MAEIVIIKDAKGITKQNKIDKRFNRLELSPQEVVLLKTSLHEKENNNYNAKWEIISVKLEDMIQNLLKKLEALK